VTLKGQTLDPNTLRAQFSTTAGYAILQQSSIAKPIDSLLCGSTVGCPSDSLASCYKNVDDNTADIMIEFQSNDFRSSF